MIYQLLFRENGALGLPTVAVISQSSNDCLNYALARRLEFMPTDNISCIERYIYLPDGDFAADVAYLIKFHQENCTYLSDDFMRQYNALLTAFMAKGGKNE